MLQCAGGAHPSRALAEAREPTGNRPSGRRPLAAPQQRTPSHDTQFLETSEDFAAPAYGALDISIQPSRTLAAPSRHSRANAATTGSTQQHENRASAIHNVLQACSSVLSAEPSCESVGHRSYQGPQPLGGYMHAADSTQYTNVLFSVRNSTHESEVHDAPSSVAAAGTLESENSALTGEISRTVAGSLCLPYEPHNPSDTDPSSSGRVTVSTVPLPMAGSTARRSCKSLAWGDEKMSAENSWATVAREESMHKLLEDDNGVPASPQTAAHCRTGACEAQGAVLQKSATSTRQQRVVNRQWHSLKRDWTRSQSNVATVRAHQEAAAVARYNRRLKHMHVAFLESRSSNMESHMAALRAAGGATALLTRRHAQVPQASDRRSMERVHGSMHESRRSTSFKAETGTDHSVAVAMATNPLMGILKAGCADACPDSEEPLKIPDGTCLLSPFCLLESATAAANRPENDPEEVPIASVVFGMGTSHPLRRCVIAVTQHWAFDMLMTLAIVVSCGSMTVERPTLPEDSVMMAYIKTSNLVLTIVFAIEGALKIVTYSPRNYWQSNSNKIDALIVLISLFLMTVEGSELKIFKYMRCFAPFPPTRPGPWFSGCRPRCHPVALLSRQKL